MHQFNKYFQWHRKSFCEKLALEVFFIIVIAIDMLLTCYWHAIDMLLTCYWHAIDMLLTCYWHWHIKHIRFAGLFFTKKEIFLSKRKWFSISRQSSMCIDNKARNDFHKKSCDEVKDFDKWSTNDQQNHYQFCKNCSINSSYCFNFG